MSYFVFPQSWIAPAITAAIASFGSIPASPVRVIYRSLSGESLGEARAPDKIVIDKRDMSEWPRNRAQCVIAHEYGHLAGFRDETNTADPRHSDNPNSLMYFRLSPKNCNRWLARHGL